ncbi:DNA gyrase/topoisomerase IV subunit A [Candidatus Poriferisodalis sp.]|uniref:DNA gyrase/topoisomerase IV subunit A n=1 Tax=Candidatus Poriferisodalis sp. TaxID=3101277 RepID=UPI003B027AD1
MAGPTAPTSIAREIHDVDVADEMRDSFMPYALSVTTARAIPDVRDGLKPVQRRIMYVMDDLGLRPGTPFRKSAGVVGEVMGKYHPHGDGAIYEAMVRMGQSFAMSVPLVDPKGNFGSLDDPPAAYRYTEARLAAVAMTMVAGIDEDTVDLVANFDGERSEPSCLPALLPNLLVNGASGIAVGMATNMAPHNLAEVASAIKLVLRQRRPKPTTAELMSLVRGPDFPSGGTVIVDDGLVETYESGRGTIRIRAKAHIEPITARRDGIVVTELPYMVGPERVQAKVRELAAGDRIEGVAAVNDLSDRNHGLRLVIECKPGVDAQAVLSALWALTPLEDTFGINNVALVDGVPRQLGLRALCEHYIAHRLDVIIRRTQYRLDRALEREHIVAGLLIALDNIDTVIAIIRSAADVAAARAALMARLDLTEIQANHILDMQLRRLTALETQRLRDELGELRDAIAGYRRILDSDARRRTIVERELDELVEEFAVPRRTEIRHRDDLVSLAPPPGDAEAGGVFEFDGDQDAAERTSLITLSTSGLLGRRHSEDPLNAKPGRHDVLVATATASDLDAVHLVTDRGRVLREEVRAVPEMLRGSRGGSVREMFSLARGEQPVSLFGDTSGPIAIITRAGIAKRLDSAALGSIRSGNSVISLGDGDRVVAAFEAPDGGEIALVASTGHVLRFAVDSVTVRGPGAAGVTGIKLRPGATVLAAGSIAFGTLVAQVTDEGALKVTEMSDVPSRGRNTSGSPTVRLSGFETQVAYAWVGVNRQVAAITAPQGDISSPDPTPVRPQLDSTRRNGAARGAQTRIVTLGEYRF